jgi:hypothetical protein
VRALDPVSELPRVLVNMVFANAAGDQPGAVFNTPFGDQGFFSCGQFDQHEGVASFRDGEIFLIKDRGYAAELAGTICT